MLGWRGKIVFLLMAYFAGFATANHLLTPKDNHDEAKQTYSYDVETSYDYDVETRQFTDTEFTQSFNTGMHKCFDFCFDLAKDMSARAGRLIKEKLKERL